ncbi:MAG: aspartyl protease family protein [Candidatus Aegiribacteria sp.]|nr:aspartyl protease family protein [Candidatus Aegiribacteria sp.]
MQIEIIENYIVVPATMNAALEGRFLLDTGADATVVVPQLAKRLGLKTTHYHIGGVAGGKKIKVPLSNIDALSIDGHSTALDPVAIVDINKDPGPYGKTDGVIGSDFLRKFPVTIDYPRSELIFEETASLEKRKQNGTVLKLTLLEETTPFLRVWLNGTPKGDYKLDTGAGTTQLPLEDLTSLGIKEGNPSVNVQQSSSLGGSYRVLETRLESFSLAPEMEIKDLRVKAYECKYGFIGGDYLRNFVVTLNYKDRYIVLTRS